MIVFGLEPSVGLSWEISKKLNCERGKLEVKSFPDGESYVRVMSRVKSKEAVAVSSARTSDDLINIFLLLDALRESGARVVHAVVPYLPYARQDKIFNEGEALSSRTILRILDELADDITTVNCHFLNESGIFNFKGVNIRNIDATPALTSYFKAKLKNPLVIAPDAGSLAYAKKAAHQLDCDFNHLQKKRVSGEEVVIKDKTIDAAGKDVLMLDDIISTGGTIVKSCQVIQSWKPASVSVGCVHGLFLNGIEQFQSVLDRLVSANTLESPVSKVSVADLVAADLKS